MLLRRTSSISDNLPPNAPGCVVFLKPVKPKRRSTARASNEMEAASLSLALVAAEDEGRLVDGTPAVLLLVIESRFCC